MSNPPEKPGCPDGDWCRGNLVCFWDCSGEEGPARVFCLMRLEKEARAAGDIESADKLADKADQLQQLLD